VTTDKDLRGPPCEIRLPPSPLIRPNYATSPFSLANTCRPSIFPLYFLEYVRLQLIFGEGQLWNCLVFDTIFRTNSVDYAHLGRPDSRLSVSTALSRRRHSDSWSHSCFVRKSCESWNSLYTFNYVDLNLFILLDRDKRQNLCLDTNDTHETWFKDVI